MSMKKVEKKVEKVKKLNWIDDQFAVSGVKNYSELCTFFNLYVKSVIGSIAIYGCKVITGREGDFISFPSYSYTDKDGDTKYRNHVSIILDDGVADKIIEEVANQI